MAFDVEFGEIQKKRNSLSKNITATRTYSCTLLDDTSVVHPKFRVRVPMHPYPFIGVNYCHCAEFGRYYRVHDITWTQEGWVVSCDSDSLASFREAIVANSDVYIERAESEFDGRLTDTLYPVKPDPLTTTREIKSPWEDAMTGAWFGTYIVSVQGNTTTYIAFYSLADLQQFFAYLYSDLYCDSIFPGGHAWVTEFKQMKAQLNIPQYINSIEWFPYMVPADKVSSVGSTTVGFGEVPTGGQYQVRDPGVDIVEVKFDIKNLVHPQAEERGEYLNWSPYSNYYITLPPFGIAEIPQTYLNDLGGTLVAHIVIDLHTGMARLEVHEGNDLHKPYLIQSQAKLSVPVKYTSVIQLGTNGFDIVGKVLNSGASLAGNLLTGNAIGVVGNVVNLTTGILSSVASGLLPVANTSGSTGGAASIYGNAMVSAVYHLLVDEEKAQYGRPLYKKKTISSLSGFVKLANADRLNTGDATNEEIAEIRQACLEGIYVEE